MVDREKSKEDLCLKLSPHSKTVTSGIFSSFFFFFLLDSYAYKFTHTHTHLDLSIMLLWLVLSVECLGENIWLIEGIHTFVFVFVFWVFFSFLFSETEFPERKLRNLLP